ncbi:MAG: hypothetical protein ACRD6X_14555 [Pyrinomonadaceae bacterium]
MNILEAKADFERICVRADKSVRAPIAFTFLYTQTKTNGAE